MYHSTTFTHPTNKAIIREQDASANYVALFPGLAKHAHSTASRRVRVETVMHTPNVIRVFSPSDHLMVTPTGVEG